MRLEDLLYKAPGKISRFVKRKKLELSTEGVKESIDAYISYCEGKTRLTLEQAKKLREMLSRTDGPWVADIKHFYFNAGVAALGATLDIATGCAYALYLCGIGHAGEAAVGSVFVGSALRGTYAAARVIKCKIKGERVPYLTLGGVIPYFPGFFFQPLDMYIHKGESGDEKMLARFLFRYYTIGRPVEGVAKFINRLTARIYNPDKI